LYSQKASSLINVKDYNPSIKSNKKDDLTIVKVSNDIEKGDSIKIHPWKEENKEDVLKNVIKT